MTASQPAPPLMTKSQPAEPSVRSEGRRRMKVLLWRAALGAASAVGAGLATIGVDWLNGLL